MIKHLSKRFLTMFLAMALVLTIFPTISAHAATNNSSWAIASTSKSVYRYANLTTKIGTIYADEGFTILAEESDSYYVSYSTSKGEKKGYISKSSLNTYFNSSCAGQITSGGTVYFGPSSSIYASVGSVSTGEYVAVLAAYDGWTYIEYNTSTVGRKRGFISSSKVSLFEDPPYLPGIYGYINAIGPCSIYVNTNVYRGTGTQYEVIDNLVGKTFYRIGEVTINNRTWTHVRYYTDVNSQKTGWIME